MKDLIIKTKTIKTAMQELEKTINLKKSIIIINTLYNDKE